MAIEFPGYKAVIKNTFYARDSLADGLTEGLVVVKYKWPNANEIFRYIQGKAAKVCRRPRKKLTDKYDWDQAAEVALSRLPRDAVIDIRDVNGAIVDYVMRSISAKLDANTISQTYIQADSGHLDKPAMRKARKADPHEAIDAISVNLGDRLSISFKLADGSLPSKRDMEVLRRHAVTRSDSLIVNGSYGPRTDGLAEALYTGLSSPGAIGKITDLSQKVIVDRATMVLVPMVKSLEARNAIVAFAKIMKAEPMHAIKQTLAEDLLRPHKN
jgi:hypothetical protein